MISNTDHVDTVDVSATKRATKRATNTKETSTFVYEHLTCVCSIIYQQEFGMMREPSKTSLVLSGSISE